MHGDLSLGWRSVPKMGAVVIGNLYPNPSSAMEISYNSELSAWMNKSSVAIPVYSHVPVYIRGDHKWSIRLCTPLGFQSKTFSMYCTTRGCTKTGACVYIWCSGLVEYYASQNAISACMWYIICTTELNCILYICSTKSAKCTLYWIFTMHYFITCSINLLGMYTLRRVTVTHIN